jgi:hypothetical protein
MSTRTHIDQSLHAQIHTTAIIIYARNNYSSMPSANPKLTSVPLSNMHSSSCKKWPIVNYRAFSSFMMWSPIFFLPHDICVVADVGELVE